MVISPDEVANGLSETDSQISQLSGMLSHVSGSHGATVALKVLGTVVVKISQSYFAIRELEVRLSAENQRRDIVFSYLDRHLERLHQQVMTVLRIVEGMPQGQERAELNAALSKILMDSSQLSNRLVAEI